MALSLSQCLDAFVEDCKSRDYSPGTLAGYRKDIGVFIQWAWKRQCLNIHQVTADVLDAYQHHLILYRTRQNAPLKASTRKTYLMRLQALLQWLTRQGILNYCPVECLILPETNAALPKVLSVSEMEALITFVDVQAPYGVRDRAILETLYSTGMRGIEAARLRIGDLEPDSGWVTIRQGKWKKDRRIPIGDSAVSWLQQYLNYERPKAKRATDYDQVFLSNNNQPYQDKGISSLVHRYLQNSGLRTQGGSHLIRHSMATHMLQNGADIRYIQQMLGHSDLSSTQIYTRVEDRTLKAVHRNRHPASGDTGT